MPNHKDFWAGLSIQANPIRFTYGGHMKYMLLIHDDTRV
jgi:hypothetical protein